jgi:flavin reductase (DIM6/NTAB) family NADH-FMN oxidoreductase RutF
VPTSDRTLGLLRHEPIVDRTYGGSAGVSGQCGIDGDLRFAAEHWGVLETGAPVLNDTVGVFDYQVIDSVATKTHTVFVASVVAARLDPSREPLIYLRGRYAKALAA